jgi:ATP-dependent DNA helicase DinG
MYDLNYIFNTLLANTIKEYERRKEQLQMAYRVKEALERNDILMVEAGTGIGKSLAYLIPAILWLDEGKRIIISTYTKTLQNQLLVSDIPLAKSVLGSAIVANVAFGGENYLCRRRFKNLLSEGAFLPFQQNEVEKLILWQKTTRTGLRSEAEENGKISIWNDISRGRNTCIGKLCKERQNCYYEYARLRLSLQIIIYSLQIYPVVVRFFQDTMQSSLTRHTILRMLQHPISEKVSQTTHSPIFYGRLERGI